MKVIAKPSFERDLKKLSKKIQLQVLEVYMDLKSAENLSEILKVKKMVGYKDAYRVKIGDFKLGFFMDEDEVILARILNRRDIYKFFP